MQAHEPTIRRASAIDLPAILAISNRAAAETHANFAIAPETLESWAESFRETEAAYPWLVAEGDGGAVVAFAKAAPWKGRCAYTYSAEISVYVDPAHHRRGLGRALYARLLALLAAQGYQTALGGIALPNEPSVRLHEFFGMERVAVLRRVGWKFGRWHDVGYWQALLQPDGTPPPARILTVTEAEARA